MTDAIHCQCSSETFKLQKRIYSNGTGHVEARCSVCGAKYQTIKSTPTEDAVLHFGKYKGQKLADILRIDRAYVRWVAENMTNATAKKARELLDEKSAS